MGALDVVADHADMAMDEGEANVTSWRTVVPQLKAQVAVNTQAIEVRVCLNASISALRLSDADPPGLSASPQELRAQLDALEASTTGGEHHRVGHGSEQRGGDGKGGDGKGDGKGGDGRGDGKGGDGKGDGKGGDGKGDGKGGDGKGGDGKGGDGKGSGDGKSRGGDGKAIKGDVDEKTKAGAGK